MTTVGILGGGQLARMLALSGAPLGLRFLVLDTTADACAAQFVPSMQADYRDETALAAFAAQVDVATFDFENIPAESARWLAERIPVFPNPRALAVAQDRLAEKNLFRELGIDVPEFVDVTSRADLDAAVARVGVPAILKTRRLGYDGKGQFRIKSAGDLDAAWLALGAQAQTVGLILEAFVPFEREISVVAVRGRDGEFRAWPLTENWHESGVLSASLACTTPATGPSKARKHRSSKTTCEPCLDCPWATLAASGWPACSTGSVNCRTRPAFWPKPPVIGMTTEKNRGPAARWATQPSAPIRQSNWPPPWKASAKPSAASTKSPPP